MSLFRLLSVFLSFCGELNAKSRLRSSRIAGSLDGAELFALRTKRSCSRIDCVLVVFKILLVNTTLELRARWLKSLALLILGWRVLVTVAKLLSVVYCV